MLFNRQFGCAQRVIVSCRVALLLYCLALGNNPAVSTGSGVCGSEVCPIELGRLRAYTSDIPDPEACMGSAESRKRASAEFKQVLRQIVSNVTPLSFEFPMIFDTQALLATFIKDRERDFEAALWRVADTVQYEVIASWDGEPVDTATPVSGAEYRKRREQEMARVSAVDEKLRRVAGRWVRQWKQRQDRKNYRWFAWVGRENRDAFLAALRSAGPSSGIRIRLSGPWPPDEFADA
jgi:hypothetical protein